MPELESVKIRLRDFDPAPLHTLSLADRRFNGKVDRQARQS
jgi:hypothetical protein